MVEMLVMLQPWILDTYCITVFQKDAQVSIKSLLLGLKF